MAKYRSPIAESVHRAMHDAFSAGVIDKVTMREFDLSCLTTVVPLAPAEIAAIRAQTGLSQAAFASALNVTVSLVSKWERGEKRPSGASLKLLSLVKAKGLDAIL